ncbi:TRAP transporter small permease subunit [Paracandidimonas lactea]|uniref:TRAP transporter small permease subunit n=1 Tax=Paracandidimonas lactea TaxID=2895524 RepID=UPI001F414367|nr:TRAP transporter small permease [Paracandidimonas lactea]
MSAAPSKNLPRFAAANTEGAAVGHASSETGPKARARGMQRVEAVLGVLFGVIFLALSAIVSVETICRKVFNFSLQGADELGGYALAVGSTLAFSIALIGRAHIRVDVFHERFPKRMQAWLNALSVISLSAFGLFIGWNAVQVLIDTLSYGSTAPTPWATPLIYPQSVWFIALGIFAAISTVYGLRAIGLLLRRDESSLLREFSPKSVKEEVKEELDDLAKRQQGEA